MEETFIMIKPDAVRRKLIGKIILRIEEKGYEITGLKMMVLSEELAKRHYEQHKNKPFFKDLIDFITSGPVVILKVKGENVIEGMRALIGETNPLKAFPGTIRGDFAHSITENVIHASDSLESALREINLFFSSEG